MLLAIAFNESSWALVAGHRRDQGSRVTVVDDLHTAVAALVPDHVLQLETLVFRRPASRQGAPAEYAVIRKRGARA